MTHGRHDLVYLEATAAAPSSWRRRSLDGEFDADLLAELPAGVVPCGERGEFHTVCYRCPQFNTEIRVTVGDVVQRDGFWFADLRNDPRFSAPLSTTEKS
jgi:diphthamide synthase (EF-2-diphthine--ammonia ligase)